MKQKLINYLDENGKADEKAIAGITEEQMLKMYRLMNLTRLWNDKALSLQRQGRLGTMGSVRGQEASNVGMAMPLQSGDWFVPAFREYGALFTLGVPMKDQLIYWGGDERGARVPDNLKIAIKNKEKHVLPGVFELLKALDELDSYWLGLLTGNIEPGARIKLNTFDLNKYFPFGAFGSDNEDRNKLLPIAVEKFREMTRIDIPYSDCIVIGDTPSDVVCSKPYGARSIAVATGRYRYEALLQTQADHVLEDLTSAMPIICQDKKEDHP